MRLTRACGLLTLLALALCACTPIQAEPFDAKSWAENRSIEMALDVQETGLLNGQSVSGVKSLLGEADMEDVNARGDGALQYNLPRGWYLSVSFQAGHVDDVATLDPG